MILEIDGSYGEGGGQLLRTSLFLSIITEIPFRMYNIRAGREKPGLKPQHLHILKTLELISNSKVTGAKEGAMEITFTPGPVKGGKFFIDIGTAGSIPLLLQSILPISSQTNNLTRLRIRGGTDVPGGMTSDYLRFVLIPHIKFMFEEITLKIKRRGFYPRGGGEIEIVAKGASKTQFKPLNLEKRGKFIKFQVYSVASSNLKKRRVAERQIDGIVEAGLKIKDTEVSIEYSDALSPGTAVTVVAVFENTVLGCDNLGKLGKPAEVVGREAWECMEKLLRTDCTVDKNLEDNLIPYLGLFGGAMRLSGEPTLHTKSNIWITEKFIGSRFRFERNLLKVTPGPRSPISS